MDALGEKCGVVWGWSTLDQEPPLIGDALSDGTAAQVLEDRQAPFDQLRVVCPSGRAYGRDSGQVIGPPWLHVHSYDRFITAKYSPS